MLWLLINTGLAEVCSDPIGISDFDSYLAAMTVSFAEQDLELLTKNWSKLEDSIPCIDEKMPSESALKFHLLTGLYYAITEEEFKMLQSLSAAKSIDSSVTIPTYIFPEAHYVHEKLSNVEVAGRVEPKIQLDRNQILQFDGVDVKRPKDAPTIVQLIEKDVVIYTQYLGPFTQVELLTKIEQSAKYIESMDDLIQQRRRMGKRIALGTVASLSGLIARGTAMSFMDGEPDKNTYTANQFFFGTFLISASALGYDLAQQHFLSKEES